jgi:hypothetical protein
MPQQNGPREHRPLGAGRKPDAAGLAAPGSPVMIAAWVMTPAGGNSSDDVARLLLGDRDCCCGPYMSEATFHA